MALSQPTAHNFSPDLLQALNAIKSIRVFHEGAPLYQQGAMVSGIYVVESGEVRVLLPTGQNQKQLLEVLGPGSVLGLSENLSGESYRVTTEAGEETMTAFVPRDEFLGLLREHNDFSMQVVRLLSEELHGLYRKFRSITAHPGRPRQRPLNEQLN